LSQVPVLLPTTHSAARGRLDQWFERQGVRPNIEGEFEGSALLKTFGAGGMGVFPAVRLVHDDMIDTYGVKCIGVCEGVEERFYALAAHRKAQHPLVQQLLRG
jgi:LysR family transcriptional activator of nhaA